MQKRVVESLKSCIDYIPRDKKKKKKKKEEREGPLLPTFVSIDEKKKFANEGGKEGKETEGSVIRGANKIFNGH